MTENEKPARSYVSADIKKLDGSRVEISASIATETWEQFRKEAVKNIGSAVKLDGFRQGNVPENILVAKVGEMAILEEMAELALPKSYVDILLDNKIDAIGKPAIQVTKLAKGNPLEFKAITAVMPSLTLPDYKKLAAKEVAKVDLGKETVTEKDLDEAILKVRKAHASHDGHDHDKMTPEEHEKTIMVHLPELKEALLEEKKGAAREKLRIKIADAIAEAVKVELPDVMIDSELRRTQSQFEGDIERMGVKLDDYLKHAKKSLEDIRKEWRPHAEKKAKLQLILNTIAETEQIKPEPAAIEAEVEHIVKHYEDADRERAAVYAETVLTNDKVFEFLESQK